MYFTPEYSFRKLSRTALLNGATDGRWVRLNRSTRATAHRQGERPCYAKSLSHLLPQLLSAHSRWPPPPHRRTGRVADSAAASIITTGLPASASATSITALAATDVM